MRKKTSCVYVPVLFFASHPPRDHQYIARTISRTAGDRTRVIASKTRSRARCRARSPDPNPRYSIKKRGCAHDGAHGPPIQPALFLQKRSRAHDCARGRTIFSTVRSKYLIL
jgi:hypothetical protein